MHVTIIHQYDCPSCEEAIRESSDAGHEVELHRDLDEIEDKDRKCSMMADLLLAGGDKNARPLVFIDDRFVYWTPKK